MLIVNHIQFISFFVSIISFFVSIISLAVSWRASYLQQKGNKLLDKVSKHQDRLEFFQFKDKIIHAIHSFAPQDIVGRLLKEWEIILDHKSFYILLKDHFFILDAETIKKENYHDILSENFIKVSIATDSEDQNSPYRLPVHESDVWSSYESGLENQNRYLSKKFTSIPNVMIVVDQIGKGDKQEIKLKNQGTDSRFDSHFSLNKEEPYFLGLFKSDKGSLEWCIYSFDGDVGTEVKLFSITNNILRIQKDLDIALTNSGHLK